MELVNKVIDLKLDTQLLIGIAAIAGIGLLIKLLSPVFSPVLKYKASVDRNCEEMQKISNQLQQLIVETKKKEECQNNRLDSLNRKLDDIHIALREMILSKIKNQCRRITSNRGRTQQETEDLLQDAEIAKKLGCNDTIRILVEQAINEQLINSLGELDIEQNNEENKERKK